MIDGYKCRDGKVIVVDYDENNVKTEIEREYQDNIGELLIAEEIDVHLSKLKEETINNIKMNERNIEKYKDNMVPIFSTVLYGVLGIGGLLKLTILGSLGISVELIFWSLFLFLPLTLLGSNVVKIRSFNKNIKLLNLKLEGIEEEIKSNQRELRRLINDDSVSRDDISSEYVQLDCSEKLEEIDNNLSLWNNLYNEDYYLNALTEGCLDEILVEGKCLTSSDVKTLKKILTNRSKKRY